MGLPIDVFVVMDDECIAPATIVSSQTGAILGTLPSFGCGEDGAVMIDGTICASDKNVSSGAVKFYTKDFAVIASHDFGSGVKANGITTDRVSYFYVLT